MNPLTHRFVPPVAALVCDNKFRTGPTPHEEADEVDDERLHFFKEQGDGTFLGVYADRRGGEWVGSAHCWGGQDTLPYAEVAGCATPVQAAAAALAELQGHTEEDLLPWLR